MFKAMRNLVDLPSEGLRPPIDDNVHLVREVDLEPLLAWLFPLLQEDYRRATEAGVRYWLKAAMGDRHTHFVCSRTVAAMVHVVSDVLEPEPRVIEKFLRGSDEATQMDRQAVYLHLTAWAKSIGAREFVFNVDSDARMTRHIKPPAGPGVLDVLQDDRKGWNVKTKPTAAVVFKEDE